VPGAGFLGRGWWEPRLHLSSNSYSPVSVPGWNACLALVCGDVVVWKGAPTTFLVTLATTRIIASVLRATAYRGPSSRASAGARRSGPPLPRTPACPSCPSLGAPRYRTPLDLLFLSAPPLSLSLSLSLFPPLSLCGCIPLSSSYSPLPLCITLSLFLAPLSSSPPRPAPPLLPPQVGQAVHAAVGARFGRSLLELSGNNAIVVMPDADLALATRSVLSAAVGTAGQRCTTCRRLVHPRCTPGSPRAPLGTSVHPWWTLVACLLVCLVEWTSGLTLNHSRRRSGVSVSCPGNNDV